MAYATALQVQTACGGVDGLRKLSDQNGSGALNQPVVDAAVAEADALIDSFAFKRFTTPFAAPTLTIQTLSAKIAARVMRRDRQMQLMTDAEDEKNDLAWLKMLAQGLVSVGAKAPGTPLAVDTADDGTDSAREVSRLRTKGMW